VSQSYARTQHVLAVAAEVLNEKADLVVPYWQVSFTDVLSQFLVPECLSFLPRRYAETNTNYRQIIPYVIVKSNDRVLSYGRSPKSGESRLHGLRSIGWGGHVDLLDVVISENELDVPATIRSCARRELSEELGITHVDSREYIGLIVERRTEVGRVHMGCVEVWNVGDREISSLEDRNEAVRWMAADDLSHEISDFESWSELAWDLHQRSSAHGQ
jgi:predicted NUDIX family phosphoesterase